MPKTPQQIAKELRKIGEAASARAQKMRRVGTYVERSMDTYPYFLPQFEGLTDKEVDELWKTRPWVQDVVDPYFRYAGDKYGKGWLSGIKNLPTPEAHNQYWYGPDSLEGSEILSKITDPRKKVWRGQIYSKAVVNRLNDTNLPMSDPEKQVLYNFLDNSRRTMFGMMQQYKYDTYAGGHLLGSRGVNSWKQLRDDYIQSVNMSPTQYENWGFYNDTDFPIGQVIMDGGVYNNWHRTGLDFDYIWVEPKLSKWFKEGSFNQNTFTFNLNNFFLKDVPSSVYNAGTSQWTMPGMTGAEIDWHAGKWEGGRSDDELLSVHNKFVINKSIIEKTLSQIEKYNAARMKVGDGKSVINSNLSSVQFLRQRTASAFSDPSFLSKVKDVFKPETKPHDNVIENTREYQNNLKNFSELVAVDNAMKAVTLSDEDFKTVINVPSGSDIEEDDKQKLATKLNELTGAKTQEFFNRYSFKFLGLDPKDAQLARNDLRMANLKEIVPYTLKLGFPNAGIGSPDLHIWDVWVKKPEYFDNGGVAWKVSQSKSPMEAEFNVLFIPKDLKHSGGKNVQVIEKDNRLVPVFRSTALVPATQVQNTPKEFTQKLATHLNIPIDEVDEYIDDPALLNRTLGQNVSKINNKLPSENVLSFSGMSPLELVDKLSKTVHGLDKPERMKALDQISKSFNITKLDLLNKSFSSFIEQSKSYAKKGLDQDKLESVLDLKSGKSEIVSVTDGDDGHIKRTVTSDQSQLKQLQALRKTKLLSLKDVKTPEEREKIWKSIKSINGMIRGASRSIFKTYQQDMDKVIDFAGEITAARNAEQEMLNLSKSMDRKDRDVTKEFDLQSDINRFPLQRDAVKSVLRTLVLQSNAFNYERIFPNDKIDEVNQVKLNRTYDQPKTRLLHTVKPSVRKENDNSVLQIEGQPHVFNVMNTSKVDLNKSYDQPKTRLLHTVKPSVRKENDNSVLQIEGVDPRTKMAVVSSNNNNFSIARVDEAGKAETGTGKKIIVKKEKTKMPGDRLGITNIVLGSSFLSGARALLLPNGSLFKMKN